MFKYVIGSYIIFMDVIYIIIHRSPFQFT